MEKQTYLNKQEESIKRYSCRDLKNNSGFTLIEVLISILILSIIITSATIAMVYAAKVSRENRLRIMTMNLAVERVEYIRSLEFAEAGTRTMAGGSVIYGDPKGDIWQAENMEVDGNEYTINTIINWETQGGWSLSNTDWDYKSVKVSVVPTEMEGNNSLTSVIETYVTRESTQPALTGANINLRVIRGWNTTPGVKVPVDCVKVKLTSGPSAPRQVQTSSGGMARFLSLIAGSYTVNVDPTNLGMILNPQQASNWSMSIANGVTQTKEFEAEYPCKIRITLKNLDGNPITMNSGVTASLSLDVPYGTDISKNFNSMDINSQGQLPENYITGLWPVGTGYTGVYTITNISLPESQYMGSYEVNGAGETLWPGKFENPGTCKYITCYFVTIPITVSGISTNWVDGSDNIRTDTSPYTATDFFGNRYAGRFSTETLTERITMPGNIASNFYATALYFENKGTASVPGLYLKNRSNLVLHAGLIVFRGRIQLQTASNPSNYGKITLSTTYEDGSSASTIDGSMIGGTSGTKYSKLYLAKQMVMGGSVLLEPGGYYFYDGLVLPNNGSELIPITKDNYISN